MKMAKATEQDMEAALAVSNVLEELHKGYLPIDMLGGEDSEFYDPGRHAEDVIEHLLALTREASMFRVCFGITVLLDPENEIVDPDASHLELHQKYKAMELQRDDLAALLDSLTGHDVTYMPDGEVRFKPTEGHCTSFDLFKNARAAVAKIKGKP